LNHGGPCQGIIWFLAMMGVSLYPSTPLPLPLPLPCPSGSCERETALYSFELKRIVRVCQKV